MAVAVYGGGVGLAMLAKATQVALHTMSKSESASINPLIKRFLKQSAFEFIMKWNGQSDDFDVVEVGEGSRFMCKVFIETADKPSPHGFVASSWLVDGTSSTLATVVARTKGCHWPRSCDMQNW